jgi:hypothetical protein
MGFILGRRLFASRPPGRLIGSLKEEIAKRSPQRRLSMLTVTDITHVELYFRALLVACKNREKKIGKKLCSVEDRVLSCPNRVTVNLSLSPHLGQILDRLRTSSGIDNISEIMRRLLVLSDGDLEQATLEELRSLAYAYAYA